MEYKQGESYTGYHKGSVFEFKIIRVVDDGLYEIETDDGIGYIEERETLDNWSDAYKDYLNS